MVNRFTYCSNGPWKFANRNLNCTLNCRYCSPELGRFLSKDPFSGFVELPGSLNPYSYAYNNPVNLTDPSGRFVPLLVPLILGGAIGGGFAAVAYMQAHPCADFWSDPAFQRAVGVGILGGIAGAGAGMVAGFAVGFAFGVSGGSFLGAVASGIITGGASGAATQMTANALTERPMYEGVLEAAVSGAVAGGVFAVVGYGVGIVARQISARPTSAGIEFPEWRVGDSITKATPEGSYPEWRVIRERYWMNRAALADEGEFSPQNLGRMQGGKAPKARVIVQKHDTGEISVITASKDLHHNLGNRGVPGFDEPIHLREVWPWEHADLDPNRFVGYDFLGFSH